ncbi:DUF6141 family protein [Pontibacter sp. H249]|uniref:DUF6141 family protein n=1 Tax=Pontibacter sp. H249 TaxID=3133420 RepID=UPI0030BCA09C
MADQVILFKEQQRFRQFWLWAIILGAAALFWAGFIYQVALGGQFGNRPVSDVQLAVLFALMGVCMPWFFYYVKLTTEVKPGEMRLQLRPFHVRPVVIHLHVVRHYEKVLYNPVRDYGGWGIRWGFKGKAYNMSGNEGVKLYFYNHEPLLIGSQDADKLFEAIKLAKELK